TRHRANGHHDARNGWLSGDRRNPEKSEASSFADHSVDRQGNEGRSREVSRSRCLGLSRQAGRYRTASLDVAQLAAPMSGDTAMAVDKVNILLVDDQPAKLLSHQAVLQDLNENLLCASGAREAFEVLLKNEVAVIL